MLQQDEIIEIAKQTGFEEISKHEWTGYTNSLEAFAKLVAAKEREAFVVAVTEAVDKTRKATLEEMIYEHPTIAIKKAVEYAVKAEREQIIAITETQEFSRMYGEFTPSAYDLVKAIRARGTEK